MKIFKLQIPILALFLLTPFINKSAANAENILLAHLNITVYTGVVVNIVPVNTNLTIFMIQDVNSGAVYPYYYTGSGQPFNINDNVTFSVTTAPPSGPGSGTSGPIIRDIPKRL